MLYLIYIFINKIRDKIFKILIINNQILNKNYENKKEKISSNRKKILYLPLYVIVGIYDQRFK